ncbi:MAG TPA: discoidin domain-containing protein [Cellvibrio sp.]
MKIGNPKLCQQTLLVGLIGLATATAHAQTNLAQGKVASVSSSVDVYGAGNTIDGNQSTYWESQNNAFPQSLTLDLGSAYNVNQVRLKLPANWGSRTQNIAVSGSVNGSSYSTLVNAANYNFVPGSSNTVNISVPGSSARYVRVNVASNTGWPAAQISEMEIYGDNQMPPRDATAQIKATSYNSMSGIQTEATSDTGGGSNIGWIDDGDWVAFNNVNFGTGVNKVTARVATNTAGGTIEMRLGGVSGSLIGTIAVANTGGWQNWVTKTANVSAMGTQDLYLVFKGTAAGGLFNVNWLQFSNDNGPAVPAAPQNLLSTGKTTSSVSLSWTAASGADGYEILRNGNLVTTTTSTAYTDSGLSAATTYAYTVRAFNAAGSSAQSNSVNVTTDSSNQNPLVVKVSGGKPIVASTSLGHTPPTNAVDNNQATYWESNNNAFPQTLTVDLGSTHRVSKVVLKLPNDMAWATRTQTLSVLASSNGTAFTTLVNSTGHVFNPASANTVTINFAETATRYVRINVTGNTGWPAAQISEFEVHGYPDPVPPATPQNVVVAGGTSSTLYLSWDAADLASGYKVLRNGTQVADVTTTYYQDTGLTASTSYQYQVRAYNQFGNSALSTAATGTTLAENQNPNPGTQRGANMPYTMYQAEDATVGGGAQKIGPNRIVGDLAGEASGRRAVTLHSTGSYVEFTTNEPTNTLVTRFSIPDAPGGDGISSTLNIYVNGQFEKAITLSSKHAWLYGNETSPGNSPSAGPARHIYDEANVMFDRTIPQGSKIRLQKDAQNSSQYAIDFISLEQVSPIPNPNPSAFITPTGFTHQAVQNALDQARMGNALGVYLPAGVYQTSNKFQVYGKAIQVIGAGPWYTRFETPANQSNTDAGFAASASANGSTFANFAFFGNYTSRIDGPGKVFDFNGTSNMTIDNIWTEHQVCMFWGSSAHNTTIKNSRIRNMFADGINFTNGSSGNHVVNNEARSTGDDSFALFAATDNGGGIVQNNLYENLTAMTPWRAAGLAAYGGQGNTYKNIHIEDALVYSGVTISSLDFGYPFTGFQSNPTTNFEGITILRSGGTFWNNQVFPALWMFSASKSFQGIRIRDLDIIDPTFHGIMFQTNYVGGQRQNIFQDTIFTNVKISGAMPNPAYPNRSGYGIWANPMPEAGQGCAAGQAEFNNLTMMNNAVNIKNDCPGDFTITVR